MKKLIVVALACALLTCGTALGGTIDYPVTFRENPTTGYEWTYAVGDEAVLAVADIGYTAPENAGQMEGVGGTHTWVVSGLKEGEATVTFTYTRSWESAPDDPVVTYTFSVDADKNLTLVSAEGLPEQYMPNLAVIRLIENPTTGYLWVAAADKEGILVLENDYYTADAVPEGMVGSGGVHTWIYNAAQEGTVVLTLGYARSFEPDEKPVATVTFTYQVDKQLYVTLISVDGDYDQYNPDVQQ